MTKDTALIERLRKGAMYICGSPLEEAVPIHSWLTEAADRIEALQNNMRMIVSHATGGSFDDIDRSVNDICCEISRNRNHVYQAGKDAALDFLTKERWQDIESAPRDGTDVLLFTDSGAMPAEDVVLCRRLGMGRFTAIQIGQWEDAVDAPMRKQAAGWRTVMIGKPTHWRPLPASPEQSRIGSIGEGE